MPINLIRFSISLSQRVAESIRYYALDFQQNIFTIRYNITHANTTKSENINTLHWHFTFQNIPLPLFIVRFQKNLFHRIPQSLMNISGEFQLEIWTIIGVIALVSREGGWEPHTSKASKRLMTIFMRGGRETVSYTNPLVSGSSTLPTLTHQLSFSFNDSPNLPKYSSSKGPGWLRCASYEPLRFDMDDAHRVIRRREG